MKLTKATVGKPRVPEGKSELIVFDEDMPGFGLRLRAGGSRCGSRSTGSAPSSGA